MKFKVDENFGSRTYRIFEEAGRDVHTVRQELLQGASDQKIYDQCRQEGRCLVTLDLDFSDVVRFPPQDTKGIVVIRVPRNPTLPLLEKLVEQFLQMLEQMSVKKQLWIVEVGRIRIHQAGTDIVGIGGRRSAVGGHISIRRQLCKPSSVQKAKPS